jgi:hypothetical protein
MFWTLLMMISGQIITIDFNTKDNCEDAAKQIKSVYGIQAHICLYKGEGNGNFGDTIRPKKF